MIALLLLLREGRKGGGRVGELGGISIMQMN